MDERWAEIRAIWKQNHWLYVMAGFLLGVLFQPFLATISTNLNGFLQDIVPEAIGIVFTVFIIDRIYQRREGQREERELKARLISDLASDVPEIAKRAAEQIREHNWHEDGTLSKRKLNEIKVQDIEWHGADLSGSQFADANFSGTDLNHSNLEGANLFWANLERVNLNRANLKNANLEGCNLKEAIFRQAKLYRVNFNGADLTDTLFMLADCTESNFKGANLSNARLRHTNLKNANLFQAKCFGTILDEADLSGANLLDCKFNGEVYFNEQTILPDGTHWRKDTDMERFTDPSHPNFWQSDDSESPAHRDKGNPYWEEQYDWWKENE